MLHAPVRSTTLRHTLAIVALLAVVPAGFAQTIVRVPTDQATIQGALNAVSNGGVIEIAQNVYLAPTGGFVVPPGKAFTMRPVAGADVILSGNLRSDIVRFSNSDQPVTFERIIFENGFTTTNYVGGGVTLIRVKAMFNSCTFRNNYAGQTNGTGGGAVWIASGIVSMQNCTFSGNTSRNFGGGISSLDSTLYLGNCSFSANRVNVPNHTGNASGGGVYAYNSSVQVTNCAFRQNQAGFAGGAIYLATPWSSPASTLAIADSEFTGNIAQRDATVSNPDPAVGGAVHTELNVSTTIARSRFSGNVARQGGAISLFKSIVDLDSSVFRGNYTTGTTGQDGFGGTIMALSPDTNNPHQRSISIAVRDTLFEGPAGLASARQGGCIFAAGNTSAAFGIGQPQTGSVESNRGTVSLTRVAIFNCSVAGGGGLPGTGGAIQSSFLNLTIDDSIISDCSSSASGGALQLNEATFASVSNSTIARCKAGDIGNVTMFGGTLNFDRCTFIRNQNTGGRGAAITTVPQPAGSGMPDFDVLGTVQNCVFSGNIGDTTVYSGDRTVAPFNRLQYNANQFQVDGDRVFVSDFGDVQTVAEMNLYRVARVDGTVTILAAVPNVRLASAPATAALLMLPPFIAQGGGPGESLPSPSYLAFATNGGTAVLDGAAQSGSTGIVSTGAEGPHRIAAGTSSRSTTPPPAAALNISTRVSVAAGENALIAGFIVQGSAPKRVIVRAAGPSLADRVAGALRDPRLDLYDSTGAIIAGNDNWQSAQGGVEIHGTGIAPTHPLEPAIVATLNPNVTYTAVVRGADTTPGIAVVEVYDLDGVQASKLANISSRALIQSGADNVLIGGFIYAGGAGATNVVVRAIGPSLADIIANPLNDPVLDLFDSNANRIASNDDWKTNQAAIERTGLAPKKDAESAILLSTLPRGAYTAIVSGKGGATGVGVVEVYVFP